ncbi:MAG: UTP--glucose-1-phosphate uridylyltransferase [Desulfovermiculus sp.]|nr:UTP--glucose-1-phosphate uridylyltransferase [Desulfovermiculus sp.]
MGEQKKTTQSGTGTENMVGPFVHKMKQAGMPQAVIDLFAEYAGQFINSQSVGFIPESTIQPIREDEVKGQDHLSPEDEQVGISALDQAVAIKLNGGLGTSMGMPYAKSLLQVRSEMTFLDIICKQAGIGDSGHSSTPGLVLMNSFNTHADTLEYLDRLKLSAREGPWSFMQHTYPKILADSLRPAHCPEQPDLEWNPPGHGDVYAALYTSGMLEKLLKAGKRYALVSNADNLGAVLNPSILGYVIRNDLQFLMEVAQRSPADKKGGHLAKRPDGRLVLREIAQCPDQDVQAFQDIDRHSFFNTNSIWLDLQALQTMITNQGLPRLPLIVNPKNLDPRDENSPQVYQLETAMGAAISSFDRSGALHVDRRRFAPVKKTNELLVVRSDCYLLSDTYQLVPNPQRSAPPIEVDLDPEYFKKVDQFESRFPQGEPSLLDCVRLIVKGDVLFEADVICRDEVVLRNETQMQQRVEQGTLLSGEKVWSEPMPISR